MRVLKLECLSILPLFNASPAHITCLRIHFSPHIMNTESHAWLLNKGLIPYKMMKSVYNFTTGWDSRIKDKMTESVFVVAVAAAVVDVFERLCCFDSINAIYCEIWPINMDDTDKQTWNRIHHKQFSIGLYATWLLHCQIPKIRLSNDLCYLIFCISLIFLGHLNIVFWSTSEVQRL